MKPLALALLLCVAAPGCKRAEPPAPPGTAAAPRRVEIKVSNMGYEPSRLAGRPGEHLLLVFRYDPSAGECGREVLLPEQAAQRRLVLTPDKPVEVALALPPKGELQFTCGMKMLSGTLVVD